MFTPLLRFLLLLSLSTLALYALTEQNEATNAQCPGEPLTLNQQIELDGKMQSSWDIDRYYFSPPSSGTITITLTSAQETTLKAGDTCNTQTYFRSNNKTSHQESFHVINTNPIYLSLFDWDTNNYDYHLSISFVSDQPNPPNNDTTPPTLTLLGENPYQLFVGEDFTDPGATATDDTDGDITALMQTTGSVDTTKAGTYTITYTVQDQAGNQSQKVRTVIVQEQTTPPANDTFIETKDSTNGTCPTSEPIPQLQDFEEYFVLKGKGTIQSGGDIDRFNIRAKRAATLKITLQAPYPIAFKAEDLCGVTTHFSLEPSTLHQTSYHIDANQFLLLTIYDQTNRNAYDYNFTIEVLPDNAPNPPADTTPPVLTLLGENPYQLFVGESFTDPGATAIDDTDGDITPLIQTSGEVDTTKAGTYTITYTVQDQAGNLAQKSRTVIVKEQTTEPDTTPPTLTLNGENPITLQQGTPFSDPGAEATDNIDGNLTDKIQITGSIDTTKAGTYTLTYTVSDQAGNQSQKVRTVIVQETTQPTTFQEAQEATNGQCPAESIPQLEKIDHAITLQGSGVMQSSWDIDRFRFTPGVDGTIHITLTSPEPLTIKGGDACNTQTYFRSNSKTDHDITFDILANQLVSLSIFDWDTNNYHYDFTITFTPDNQTPPEPSTPYGLETRPSNPDCYFPYRADEGGGNINDLKLSSITPFPKLSFNYPVGLYQAKTGRFYVIELNGRVKSFLKDSSSTVTALDITDKTIMQAEQGLLGMALHPNFPDTPYMYLSYTDLNGNSVISRFRTNDGGVTFDKASEKYILRFEQPYENHNGGNIAFGPDGYLYAGYGDGGSSNDPHNNGQNTSTLLASMLRIDVDGGDPYAIPSDNPFAGNPRAVDGKCSGNGCPEIFAWGLRNPWRWSFDRQSGLLWAGDVGQNAWEEIDIVQKGKNYGWRCKEGFHTTTNSCTSSGPFTDPILEYPNTGYNAVTGGYVYRGKAIPALRGVYLYADYVTGVIKGYLPDQSIKTMLPTNGKIASFAEDLDGEIYYLDVWSGAIKKIIATSGANSGYTFPQTISETGCFEGTLPSSSLIPYDVNVLLWSDNLDKQRWLALQDGTAIALDSDKRQWLFPIGTVLIKEFSKDGKKIETRFLARHQDGNWGAFTYKWREDNSDADLVDVATSIDKDIGGQIWTYPSEADCFSCHTAAANYVLGPETVQMNKEITYPSTGILANQIDTYNHIGLFSPPLQESADKLDRFEKNATTAQKARAYLHSNCSGCHMPGGGTPSSMDLRYFKTLSETNTCNKPPLSGDFGIANAKIIAPGDSAHSILPYRLGTLGDGRMPPVGSHVVDEIGLALIKEWIDNLGSCEE